MNTKSLVWFRLAIWLMLVLGFNSGVAFPQVERNPIRTLRLAEPADTARVIVKFKQDTVLLRKHKLAATASARETLDTVAARASALGARLGLSGYTLLDIGPVSNFLTTSGCSQ